MYAFKTHVSGNRERKALGGGGRPIECYTLRNAFPAIKYICLRNKHGSK